MAPMPTPRTEIAVASLGDDIYVIGGLGSSDQPVDIVEVYNVKNNTWSRAVPLPQPLHHTAASSFGGKIYVVGGYFDRQWTASNKLFIYDPLKRQWQEGRSMPTARGALTANFIDGILFAIGGQSFSDGVVATNEAYDPILNTWTSKAPMLTARHHAGSALVDERLYVVGGRVVEISPALNVNVNEAYDPNQDSWISLAPMPNKRSGIAAASLNSSIYVFGGEEPTKTFDNNERYDTKSNMWTNEPPMPTARHGLGAASILDGKKIYVFGGGPKPGSSVSTVNEAFHLTR
jgi:N-acetylneuraminic acid mutarotase